MARLWTGSEAGIPGVTLGRLHAVDRSPVVLRAPALLLRPWLGLVELYRLLVSALEIAQAVEAGPVRRRRKVARAWWRETTIR